MDGESQDARGPAKTTKRKWKHEEDAKLVEVLLDMVNLGTLKADNGFKPGYLVFIEEKLKVSLPNAGIKARPHVESRIKTLRKDFTIVYDMLNGTNTSGFGYDGQKKCITAESSVWDSYLQGLTNLGHPSHSAWRNRQLPFYEDMLIIFGKDRATGSSAEGPINMVEEIQSEGNNNTEENNVDSIEDLDASVSFSPLHSPRNEGGHHQKKRRRSGSYDSQIMTDMKEASSVIASEIAKASQIFSKVFGVEADISEKRQKIHYEIRNIPNLTGAQVMKVVSDIALRPELIDVFFSMDGDSKVEFVRAILNGEI